MSAGKIITTALASVVAVGLSGQAVAGSNSMEKCYGIAKKGKNDCATSTMACSGQSSKNSEADAWIYLPKGTCDKIVGGSTKPPAPANTPAQTKS
ncbi:MAG: DUF2282 domain-containing protein [Proteobacteria bacterium]|nr:DUF2282 domain-containing protein [Pseudomonadota bacterium]